MLIGDGELLLPDMRELHRGDACIYNEGKKKNNQKLESSTYMNLQSILRIIDICARMHLRGVWESQ